MSKTKTIRTISEKPTETVTSYLTRGWNLEYEDEKTVYLKKRFNHPLFWITLFVFFPIAIIYGIVYSMSTTKIIIIKGKK